MEQEHSEINEPPDLPEGLLKEIEELDNAELANDELTADLLREQAAGPIPLEPETSGEGEDAVLLVETVSLPDEPESLSPEERMLGKMGLDEGTPWYRSRWLYIGAGVAGGAALAVGTVFFLRNRDLRRQRAPLGRAQNALSQWSHQLGNQTNKLTGQMSKLSGQATRLTGQAQDQISQLTGRKQKNGMYLLPIQRQSSASKWVKQTRRQLNDLSRQVSDQLSSIGSAIGTTTTQAVDRTQEGLAQIGQGVASGAAKTGEGIKTGWKLSRNFTLGMTAGAIWAAIFTPENGETTRQHLSAIFQPGKTRKP